MAKPIDITPLGLELYNAINPLTYGDNDANGWPLLRYCDALVHGAQQAATYGRDSGNLPGWAILANPATAPEEALTWLSQLAGVNLETLRKTVVVRQENMVAQPNFSRLAVNAVPAKWKNEGKGATTFKVTEGWVAGRKTLEVVAASMAKGEATSAQVVGPITLGAVKNLILVREGESYSLRVSTNVTSITGSMLFKMTVVWYDINGTLLKTDILPTTFTTVGEHDITGTLTAPANAVACAFTPLMSEATAAASKATVFVDKADMSPSPTNAVLSYGDGDTATWEWTGTAGESISRQQTLQSDAEYVQSRRNRIKELPSEQRATRQAIEAAAKQYLTGNKTVYIKERDGSAYKITVVTFIQETPSQSQTLAGIEEQIPGGIILTYAAVPGGTYILVRATYASYKAIGIDKAYLTYNGLRNNIPGT